MTLTTINFELDNGDVTQLSAVQLNDDTAAFGVKRTDTSAIVVAAATPMVDDGGGKFHYTFADPAPGLTYLAVVQFTYRTQTFFRELTKKGGGQTLPSYTNDDEAADLAALTPGLTSYNAASSSAQAVARVVACRDIDAQKYQGRKYDPAQVLQFPRAAYESSSSVPFLVGPVPNLAGVGGADVVWDWDATANAAVVPVNVKLAEIYQADYVLSGKRAKMLERLAEGLTSVKIGSAQKTFDLQAVMAVSGGALCQDASNLLKNYRLRQGRML